MTMHGNRRTTPSGIENFELPLNRNGRRKNASLDDNEIFGFTFSFFSTDGRSAFLAEGRRLNALCTKLIAGAAMVFRADVPVKRGHA